VSSNQRSLGDITLKELGAGLTRYRPFILAVGAVVLIVGFLPGATHKSSTGSGANTNLAAGSNAAGSQQAAAAGGTDTGTAAGGTTATGGGSSAGGKTAAGTATATGTESAPPAATTDPACDQSTGRLKIPSLYAPPCLEPFTGSNGGNTYQGVNATTITIARPVAQPNAATKAILAAGGDNDTDQQIEQNQTDYVDFFEHHFNTYGRKVKLVFYDSAVNPNDSDAAKNSEAQADATKVAKDIKAFMSLGDDGQAAYEDTLVANKVMCLCTVTLPASYYEDRKPYIWGTGLPDETQDYGMRAEMMCKELNGEGPKYAGDATITAKPARSYALMWPQDPANSYKPGEEFFQQTLKSKCGITFTDVVGFQLSDITNPGQAQQEAQTFMAKFQADGVTSIVFVGDPITPVYFTSAATRQQYFPEWIQTGSALTDTAFFGRLYDQQQWKHNFGFSALPDRVPQESSDAYNLYNWQFQKAPVAPGTYGTIYPSIWAMMLGINLAGPQLTPETFRCGQPPYTMKTFSGFACIGQKYPGMFGYPVSPTKWQSRVANPVTAFGDKLWQWDDYNQTDDGTLIWWDPNAPGKTETGVDGNGLFRFINNGKRYMYGTFPDGKQPWFDPNNTVTIFDALPGPDKPPSYPYACYYLCGSPGP
jgi:hypothetical protein